MAFSRHIVVLILQLMLVPLAFNLCNAQGLKYGFYSKTCPGVESIVRKTTAQFISKAPTLAAPLLRMQFHDCFVRVCFYFFHFLAASLFFSISHLVSSTHIIGERLVQTRAV